jgi:hypothetical protein
MVLEDRFQVLEKAGLGIPAVLGQVAVVLLEYMQQVPMEP